MICWQKNIIYKDGYKMRIEHAMNNAAAMNLSINLVVFLLYPQIARPLKLSIEW